MGRSGVAGYRARVRLDQVPGAFVALAGAGRFDYWGVPSDSLTDEEREALLPERMLQVLWWDDEIEWDRTLDDVVGFAGDGRLREGLVPFAGNGDGDQYCWHPQWQEGPEPPVVLFVHDEMESRLFARDMGELLCRCMLRHFAVHEADAGEPPRRALWDAQLAIIRPHLSDAQAALMASVGATAGPEPDACTDADDVLAAQVGDRRLIGASLSSQFVLAAQDAARGRERQP